MAQQSFTRALDARNRFHAQRIKPADTYQRTLISRTQLNTPRGKRLY